MAKSLRSKVKRSYRSKKRDDSVYSATEAARLNRLNAKLKSIISTETGNEENNAMEEDSPGWCWFAAFGLVDAMDITAETMASMRL